MTPQELKNSILQLAIQGKLVEQRAEEGSAAELVEKILAAKNAKGAKGNLTRSRGARGEKEASALSASPREEIPDDEKPFDIPESWEWVRLGDAFDIEMGQSPDGASVSEVAGGLEFHQGKIFFGEKYLKQSPQRTTAPTKIAEPNSVLLCVRAPVGKVNITSRRICIGRGLCSVLPLAGMDVDFVYYLLAAFETTFVRHATGTTFVAITGKVVKMFPIPLPPLAEQKRIVAKIEELLPLIDRYEKAWSKLEDFNKRFPVDMQKSLLQMAIQGKLVEQRAEEGSAAELLEKILAAKNAKGAKKNLTRSRGARGEKNTSVLSASPREEIPDDEIPFVIPDSWKWVRLGQIGCTNIGLTYGPKDVCKDGVVVLRSSNIQNGKIDYTDIVKVSCAVPDSKMCHAGDILICARNGSKRLVGKAALVKDDRMSFGAFMAIFRSICNPYILYVINSAYFRNSLLEDTGTTTINQITQDMLRNVLVPLPPLAEQKRIVAKLEELLPLCERLK